MHELWNFDFDELKDLVYGKNLEVEDEDEISYTSTKRNDSSDTSSSKPEKLKLIYRNDEGEIIERERNEKSEIFKKINKPYMKRDLIIIISFMALYSLLTFVKDSLIIGFGITFVKVLQSALMLGICLTLGNLIFWFAIKTYVKSKLKESDNKGKLEQKEVYKTKDKYKGIENTKQELYNLFATIKDNEEGKKAKKIISGCLDLLKRASDLQEALNIILQRCEEYSLEEVVLTMKEAGEKIGTNIFKITNRLVLELNIEGFDETKINKYMENNEEILTQCTTLVKEALDYIESKDNLNDNTIGIETLTETIQSLKKLNTKEVN